LGDPSPELGKELNPEFLPKGAVLDPEAFEVVGVSGAVPKTEPVLTPAGGATGEGATSGDVILRRQWSAGQRSTVKKYFQDEE